MSSNSMKAKTSFQIKQLKSDIAFSFIDNMNVNLPHDQVVSKMQKVALKKVEMIEKEVRACIDGHLHKTIHASNTMIKNPFFNQTGSKNFNSRSSRDGNSLPTTQNRVFSYGNMGVLQPFRETKSKVAKDISNNNIKKYADKKKKELFIQNILEKEVRDRMVRYHEPERLEKSSTNSVIHRSQSTAEYPSYKISHTSPVPLEIRKNPFAVVPVLTLNDLNKGIYTLVNQGYLPTSHIDLTPALDRNDPLIKTKPLPARELLESESKNKQMAAKNHRIVYNVGQSSDDAGSHNSPEMKRSVLMTQQQQGGVKSSKQTSQGRDQKSRDQDGKQVHEALKSMKVQPKIPTIEEMLKRKNQKFITVVNGKLVKNESYHKIKSLNLFDWGDIEELSEKVLAFAISKKILNFRIYLSRLKDLSILMRDPVQAEFISCIENYDTCLQFSISNGFKSDHTVDVQEKLMRVAMKIQTNFRKLIARRIRNQLADIRKRILMIQFKYKLKRIYQETIRMADKIRAKKYKEYLKRYTEFVNNWETVATSQRVEIHLNTLGTLF